MDLEGTEIRDWLTASGVMCVLLKQRVMDVESYPKSRPYPGSPMALEDEQRTLGLVRLHAAGWASTRIGWRAGFPAGGHLAAALGVHWEKWVTRQWMRRLKIVGLISQELCIPGVYCSLLWSGMRNRVRKQ